MRPVLQAGGVPQKPWFLLNDRSLAAGRTGVARRISGVQDGKAVLASRDARRPQPGARFLRRDRASTSAAGAALDAAPKKYACSRAGGGLLPPAPELPATGAGVGSAHGFSAVQAAPPPATTSPPTAPPIATPPAEGATPRAPTPTMAATPSPGRGCARPSRGCAQSGRAGDVAAHGRSAAQAVHPLPLARPRSGGATEMQVGHEAACAAGRVT